MAQRKLKTFEHDGKSVGVYKDSETGEFVAKLKGRPQADYFTNDLDDAVGTAKKMVGLSGLAGPAEQAQSAIDDAGRVVDEVSRGACKRAFEGLLRAQGSSFYAMGAGAKSPEAFAAVDKAMATFETGCLAKLPGRMLNGLPVKKAKRKNPAARNSRVTRAAKACRAYAKGGGITNPRYQACLRHHLKK